MIYQVILEVHMVEYKLKTFGKNHSTLQFCPVLTGSEMIYCIIKMNGWVALSGAYCQNQKPFYFRKIIHVIIGPVIFNALVKGRAIF